MLSSKNTQKRVMGGTPKTSLTATATASQQNFTFPELVGRTLSQVLVYQEGILLQAAEITSLTSSTGVLRLATGATSGDEIRVVLL